MAFNFNWSPLTADASFYERAQELLTAALNKYPKPPIIVDDILVNELNLGSVPPELEILEIGDLAEDRFRGIFKMNYAGDAFLTLKTKVQANPLNTYLSAKPSFASPQPLAASSGLTIPLQITLSSIRLSAFIILVFSKQKGVTLVFRNDPLESLRVSSTFDSIPFVRDYLQKEIEAQLRTLLMEELPAIIHRLSLKLWVPEYRDQAESTVGGRLQDSNEEAVDPFSSPPQNPLRSFDDGLDQSDVPSMQLDSSSISHGPRFSQKNLVRLAALRECQRTLSLFTPSIQDAVFRAWTGSSDRGEIPGNNTPATPSLSRTHSSIGSLSALHGPSRSGEGSSHHMRGSSVYGTSFTGLSNHGSRSQPHRRKRKHRVVNLRKTESISDTESLSGESSISASTTTAPTSEAIIPEKIPELDEGVVTPPPSPPQKARSTPGGQSIDMGNTPLSIREHPIRKFNPVPISGDSKAHPVGENKSRDIFGPEKLGSDDTLFKSSGFAKPSTVRSKSSNEKGKFHLVTTPSWQASSSSVPGPTPNTVVDTEWILKMASEITRTSQNEKRNADSFWQNEEMQDAPPAYDA